MNRSHASPLTEAEAYVAEGARDIAERLQALGRHIRKPLPRRRRPVHLVADHPVATIAAVVIGAALTAIVAKRLIIRLH